MIYLFRAAALLGAAFLGVVSFAQESIEDVWLACTAILVGSLGIRAVLYWREIRTWYLVLPFEIALVFALASLSAAYTCYRSNTSSIPPEGVLVKVDATAKEWLRRLPEYDSLIVRVDEISPLANSSASKLEGIDKLIVSSAGLLHSSMHILPGDRLSFTGKLLPIGAGRNIGDPDWKKYFGARSIAGRMRLRKKDFPIVKQAGRIDSVWIWIARLRERAILRMSKYMQQPAVGVALALALGDRSMLQPEVRNQFAKSGIAHLLAISGLHIGIIAGILLLLLNVPLLFHNYLALPDTYYKIAFALLVPAVWFFAIVSGAKVPVMRASIMIAVFAFAKLVDRPISSWLLLMYAAIAVVLLFPYSVFETSFYLTFTAVAGILAAIPVGTRFRMFLKGSSIQLNPRILWVAIVLFDALWISVSASLATSPIVYAQFGVFNPLSVFNNVLMVPLVSTIVVPVAFFAAVLAIVGVSGVYVLFDLLAWMVDWLIELNARLSEVMSLDLGAYGSSMFIAVSVSFMAFLLLRIRRIDSKISVAVTFVMAMVLFFALRPYGIPDSEALIIPYTGRNLTVMVLRRDGSAVVHTTKLTQFSRRIVEKTAYAFGISAKSISYEKTTCNDQLKVLGKNALLLPYGCKALNSKIALASIVLATPLSRLDGEKIANKIVVVSGRSLPWWLRGVSSLKDKFVTGRDGAILCSKQGCRPFFEPNQ